MVAIIEGVRVEEESFPITYKIRTKICSIARHFKHPVEDALQECMMLEYDYSTHKAEYEHRRHVPKDPAKIKPRNESSMLIQALRFKLIRAWKKDTEHVESMADMAGVYHSNLVTFTRKELHTKMFVQEVWDILRRTDRTVMKMFEAKIKHGDMSWASIHKVYFKKDMSHGGFFNKVTQLRRVCEQVRAAMTDRYMQGTEGKIRAGVDGFLREVEYARSTKLVGV
jgi:hypothetical protein